MKGWALKSLFRRTPLDVAASQSYIATVQQARQPGFYEEWQVPDTAIGRFDVIALHAFLLLHRLRDEAVAEKFVEAYCAAVFDDMDRNLREMGVGDLSVGKKVRKLAEGFFGRAGAYEEALGSGDDALHDALRRNLYAQQGPGSNTLAAVADYVRRCTAALAAQDVDVLTRGEINFAPLFGESELADG